MTSSLPRSEWPEVIRAIRSAKILVLGQDDIKNEPHAAAVAAVIRAVGDSPAGFVYIEPCTARSTRRPPDIVLCHPQFGVIVFEVKGYASAQIESVNAGSLLVRHGGHIRPVNAYRQVELAMFDIKNQVERCSGSAASIPPFHAVVVLPNVSEYEWGLRGFGPSYPKNELLLRDDLEPDRLRAKLAALIGRIRPLTPSQVRSVQIVFGDSATINETRESRPAIVDSSLGAVIDELATMDKYLSAEQGELSRLAVGGFPRLIRGVAGSGKTVVLANQVARWLNRLNHSSAEPSDRPSMDHQRVAVVCFNRSLVPFLRQKIKDAYRQQTFEDVPGSDTLWVGHLESLLQRVTYGRAPELCHISPYAVKESSERATMYKASIQDYLSKHPEEVDRLLYDAIFVDEGQDFEPEEFELLLALLKTHVKTAEKTLVIYYDDAQNLYGRIRPNWKEVGIDVQRGDRARVMTECFRNTREIIKTAFNVLLGSEATAKSKVKLKTYADVAYLRQAGLIQEHDNFFRVAFAERIGDYPRIRVFQSREKEKEWIADEIARVITEEEVRPEDILVLFSYPLAYEDLADLIRSRLGDKHVRQFLQPYGKRDDRNNYIFRENCLTISTVHGAKGYDAYIVFLVGLDCFPENEAGRASFYVGATRAKQVLYLTGRRCDLLTEAEAVIRRAQFLRTDYSDASR